MSEGNYEEIDLTLAIQLQAQFEEELMVQRKKEEEKVKSLEVVGYKWNPKLKNLPEPEQEKLSVSLIDPSWESLDPNPNIYDLFLTFNHQFFWGRLMGVEVKWSPRMTLCAGVCSYEGRGGLCSVKLSVPLLKLRPRKDLVETLLHEMIHAYLFVTHNNTDHDGHGPQFHTHMFRINGCAGTKISVYHSFHDEVAVYRQHVWKCSGPCRSRPPYYGLVKRAMNRPPTPRDPWWEKHANSCGGTYTKIKEPEGYGVKKSKAKADTSVKDIRSFLPVSKNSKTKTPDGATQQQKNIKLPPKFGKLNDITNEIPQSTRQVAVQNASNANIHGFGKPVASGSSKSAKPTKTTSNGGHRKTSVGGATGMSTSQGSRTVVVKNKKTATSTSTDKTENVRQEVSVFEGTGYTLGGSSSKSWSGQSRLLAQFGNSKRKHDDTDSSNIPDTGSTKSSNFRAIGRSTSQSGSTASESTTEHTLCPMCQVYVSYDEYEKHLADCLGDFSDDDWINIPESSAAVNHNENTDSTFGTSKICDTNASKPVSRCNTVMTNDDSVVELESSVIAISDDELIGEAVAVNHYTNIKQNCDKKYPCPICNIRYKENEIDNHVNQHFS